MADTRIVQFSRALADGHRLAVSLHSHTRHSKEYLDFLPGWTDRVPVLASFVRAQIRKRELKIGRPLDFSRAYWQPPLSPKEVVESESAQASACFGLDALVSITDHDSIDAGLALTSLDPNTPHPVSVEWTVPFRDTTFHLGVHNLPRDRAQVIINQLHGCTSAPTERRIGELLAWLSEWPAVLVVLNHPLWDAKFDERQTSQTVDEFLGKYRGLLHATEINGYRAPAENAAVVELARTWDMPVLAGGDRHGRAPNAMLNLTQASSFRDFVDEVRGEQRVTTVIMPEYREHPTTRVLETISDVLRHDVQMEPGRQRWSDRVFIIMDDGQHLALSTFWKRGTPSWVRACVWVAQAIGSEPARQALRLRLTPQAEGVL